MRHLAAWTVSLGLLALAPCVAPARASVELQTRLSRSAVGVGGSVTLDVTIRGAVSGVGDPQFDVPEGVTILGSERSQSTSLAHGPAASSVLFRYELGVDRPGRFPVGPIRVRVGDEVYENPGVTLVVGADRVRESRADRGETGRVRD